MIGAVVVTACGLEDSYRDSHRPAFHDSESGNPEFEKIRMGQDFDEFSAMDLLSADERQALRNSGYPSNGLFAEELREEPDGMPADLGPEDPPKTGMRRTLDKAAGATVAILGVGVTLGMMAAPYLLF